jgi:hypothetical protein
VRLALSLRAYNLGNVWRRLAGLEVEIGNSANDPDWKYEVEQHSRWSISATGKKR